MKRTDPNRQLEFLLVEVARLQMRRYNARFRVTGLHQGQVAALIHLDRVEALSQTDLATRLGMKKAATGTIIDGLERMGLVERVRSRDDRRMQLVSIADSGRKIVDEVDRMAEELGNALRRGISREERAQFVATLQKLRENLRRMERDAAAGGGVD